MQMLVLITRGALHAPFLQGLRLVLPTTQLLLLVRSCRSISRCCRMFIVLAVKYDLMALSRG
jgi:hypothetical protein